MPESHIPSAPSGEDRGPLLNTVSITTHFIAVLVVALRFFTRGWIVRKFGFDDLFIGISVFLGEAQTATVVRQVVNGRGRHAQELTIEQINQTLLYKWINMLIYFVALWSVKMSILAMYHRIGNGKRGLPWLLDYKVIWSIGAFVTLYTVSIVIAEIFACTPISRSWDVERIPEGCFYAAGFNIAQGSINVATDVILFLLPIPLLRFLKVNTNQRVALVLIFAIGAVPLVASFMRLCEVMMSTAGKGMSWIDADATWRWSFVPLWSQVEVNVGIVAASLPSLSPLLKRAWSGFAPTRTATPSWVRTFSGRSDAWDEQNLTSPRPRLSLKGIDDLKGITFCYDDNDAIKGSNRFTKRLSLDSQEGGTMTSDTRIGTE